MPLNKSTDNKLKALYTRIVAYSRGASEETNYEGSHLAPPGLLMYNAEDINY